MSLRSVDVGLPRRDIMVAVVLDVEVGGGFEEAIDGEEVREVFLSYLAYLADEFQGRFVVVDGAAHRLHPVCTQRLEEFREERGVLLCLMVVEVKREKQAQAAVVDVAAVEGHAIYELLHGGGQRVARSYPMPHMEPAIVREEVVGALCETTQHDRELKLMPKLMCRAVLVIIRGVRIEEGLAGIE